VDVGVHIAVCPEAKPDQEDERERVDSETPVVSEEGRRGAEYHRRPHEAGEHAARGGSTTEVFGGGMRAVVAWRHHALLSVTRSSKCARLATAVTNSAIDSSTSRAHGTTHEAISTARSTASATRVSDRLMPRPRAESRAPTPARRRAAAAAASPAATPGSAAPQPAATRGRASRGPPW